MSKFRYQTEKSKYCRKSSNESIYKLSYTLPSTPSKFQETQELHLNEHVTVLSDEMHAILSVTLASHCVWKTWKRFCKKERLPISCTDEAILSVLRLYKLQAAKWEETRSHTNSTGEMPPQRTELSTILLQRQPQGNLQMTKDSCSVNCARILLVCFEFPTATEMLPIRL